jgi:hexosaminidase
MKKALKITGLILLILIAVAAIAWFGFLKPQPPPVSEEDRAAVSLMPLPAEMSLGQGNFVLGEDLSHQFTQQSSPRLERAMARFYKKLSTHTHMSLGTGNSGQLVLECAETEEGYPSLDSDESYSLQVKEDKIILAAPGETGIIYGLESLLQLAEQKNGQWVIPQFRMKDSPRYPWRGLMIDACRHWIPKDVILRNLDAMGTLKMNVFHWHLTEYQGFRVESGVYPKLHEMGSGGDYYTQDEIREVIEFAADRGIRVIPEFDLPGHSTSWFVGYPELASAPGPYELDTVFGILYPVMDPTREEVWEFLDAFFGEMAELFPDEYIHIGGDEVNPKHWEENTSIQAFMTENGLEDSHALQAHFNIRIQKVLAKHGKKMMGWDEIIHPELPREGIAVQTWRDQSSLWESARTGNQAVLSAGYYLDYKQPASFHYDVDPAVIRGAVEIEIDTLNWKSWDCTLQIMDTEMEGALYLFGEGAELRGIMDFMGISMGFDNARLEGQQLSFSFETNFGEMKYELLLDGDSISGKAKLTIGSLEVRGIRSGGTDMTGGNALPEFKTIEALTPEQEAMLLGGEACMWTEMADGLTIESRIWPRTAAIAEKLWSPAVLTGDVPDMYRRLMLMDDRLETQGLKHRSYRSEITKDMVPADFLEALDVLADLLQEDKFFNRMSIYDPLIYTTTPLNRMVDAVAPESYSAYAFGRDVDLWLESGDPGIRGRLEERLFAWATNHQKLLPAFDTSESLEEVKPHSVNLAALAALGLDALKDPSTLSSREEEIASLMESVSRAHGGTILPLWIHVQKLVESATKN